MNKPKVIYEEGDLRVVKVKDEDKVTKFFYEQKTGTNKMGDGNWEPVCEVTKIGNDFSDPTVLNQKRTGKSFKALCKKLEKEGDTK